MKASALFLILAAICGAAWGQPDPPKPMIKTARVDLTWQPSADNISTPGQIGYHVTYYDEKTSSAWLHGAFSVGTTGTTIIRRFSSQEIRFAVSAIDDAGNESEFSIPISVFVPDIHAPAIPAGITLTIRIEYAIKP